MKKIISFIVFLFFPFIAGAEGFFDDILLVIHFNHPHYCNISFLKEIYAPHFPNMVFYGEVAFGEVHVVHDSIGYFLHKTVKDVLLRYPDYRGYIICQDDCFMNFWNYPRLDKDKIWFQKGFGRASLETPQHPWCWWKEECGHSAALETYKKLPSHNLQLLERNIGEGYFPFSWSDFFYLPATRREAFLEICDCFDEPSVFLEIAIPTIIYCIEEKENIEKINAFWGCSGKSADFDLYHTDLDWFHPIKFSSRKSRAFVRKVLQDVSSD